MSFLGGVAVGEFSRGTEGTDEDEVSFDLGSEILIFWVKMAWVAELVVDVKIQRTSCTQVGEA